MKTVFQPKIKCFNPLFAQRSKMVRFTLKISQVLLQDLQSVGLAINGVRSHAHTPTRHILFSCTIIARLNFFINHI